MCRVAPDEALHELARRLQAPVVDLAQVRADGLRAWMGRATAVVVRPDRTVLALTRSRTAPGADLLAHGHDWLRLVGARAREQHPASG